MTATTQELRQGNNNISLIGEVKEHKLGTYEKDGKKSINGSLIINTGDFSDIEVGVFVGELNAKGETKKAYETLSKFISEEYKTGANANVKEGEVASKVRIFGKDSFTPQFKEDMYKKEGTDEVQTKVKIDLGFGNITVDNKLTPEQYKATFDVEVYVRNLIEEIKNDEVTGRVLIQGLLPVFGGKVFPIEIIAGVVVDEDGSEFNFGEQVMDGVEIGSTLNVWGKINYQAIIEMIKKGGGLGKAKMEEKRTYINELLAEGGEVVPEVKEFDGDLVQKAMIERDSRIEAKRNEAPKDAKKATGLGGGSTEGSATKRQRPAF